MDVTPYTTQLDAIFTALAHQKRRAIVQLLSLHPATIKQLADEQAMSLPAIHKHLRVMEQGQLILRRKVGRTNFIALKPSSLKLVRDWSSQYRADWGSDEATLENYIASLQDST